MIAAAARAAAEVANGARAQGRRQRKRQQQQQQDEEQEQQDELPPLTVVALSRLVYRKGIDLLALAIPELCARHPNVRFVIGGDGPKRRLLEAVVARGGLEARVELLGAVPHEAAREVLLRGDVFVNASLTEAFCMAIVEAASAGLLVVSTRVGGVPEVLPPDMLLLCEPRAEALLDALEAALRRVAAAKKAAAEGGSSSGNSGARARHRQHARVRRMYSWRDVAARTLRVYDAAAAEADRRARAGGGRGALLLARLRRAAAAGRWAGPLWCCALVLLHWWWRLLEWLEPLESIEPAADWPLGDDGDDGSGEDAGGSGSSSDDGGSDSGSGGEDGGADDTAAAAAEAPAARRPLRLRGS